MISPTRLFMSRLDSFVTIQFTTEWEKHPYGTQALMLKIIKVTIDVGKVFDIFQRLLV